MGVTDEHGQFSLLVEFTPYSHTQDEYMYGCEAKLDSVLINSHSRTHHSSARLISVAEETIPIQEHPVKVLEVKVAPLQLLYKIDMPPFN